jgi:hypothetical protein
MGYRRIYGNIQRSITNSAATIDPWENCLVRFQHLNGSYSNLYQYPPSSYETRTDVLGNFEVKIWANEEGLSATSVYICQLPGESFKFTLPPGNTDVSLSSVRQWGVSPIVVPPSAVRSRQFLPVNTYGQTMFVLERSPKLPHLMDLYINGVRVTFGIDYIINSLLLQWLNRYPLDTDDLLEAIY